MHLEAADTCGGESGLRARLEGSGLPISPPSKITIRDRPQNRKSGVPSQARARPPPLVSLPEVLQRDLTAPTTPMGLGGSQRPGRGAATYGVCHLLAAVEASRMPGGRPATAGGGASARAGGDRSLLTTR